VNRLWTTFALGIAALCAAAACNEGTGGGLGLDASSDGGPGNAGISARDGAVGGSGTTGGSGGVFSGGTGGRGGTLGSGGTGALATGGSGGTSTGGSATGGTGGDIACRLLDGNGFFPDCTACLDPTDCDGIDTGGGVRSACGCSTSGCPCGLTCGCYSPSAGISICDICVR